jgi:hypothetical protein
MKASPPPGRPVPLSLSSDRNDLHETVILISWFHLTILPPLLIISGFCFSLLSLFRKNKKRLMRSPCRLYICVFLTSTFLGLWDHLAACILLWASIYISGLMRSPCCLSVLGFVYYLQCFRPMISLCCLCTCVLLTSIVLGLWDHLVVCTALWASILISGLMRSPCSLCIPSNF